MSCSGFDGAYEEFATEIPFDFTARSTIGCGGCARVGFFPRSETELCALVQRLRADEKAYYILGNLSNVLPSDGVSKRVVVCTKSMKKISRENGLWVEAGVSCGALLRVCMQAGLSGTEFLEGIPCSLGGALYMNAGVNGAHMADIVESVTVLIDGKKEVLSALDCAYAYKSSVFMQNDGVILGAKLRLLQTDKETVVRRIALYRSQRAHLPKGKSMGCVFKNPNGKVAGKLIEGAGLKGVRCGGAEISNLHANFIINKGGATSSDIKSLITLVKNAVFAQYKIELQEEIRYLD